VNVHVDISVPRQCLFEDAKRRRRVSKMEGLAAVVLARPRLFGVLLVENSTLLARHCRKLFTHARHLLAGAKEDIHDVNVSFVVTPAQEGAGHLGMNLARL